MTQILSSISHSLYLIMQYGQCQLSIVPVRADHTDPAEMVTQVLFGEVFLVIEKHHQWRKIRMAHDEYEGWIDQKQMIEIEEEDFNEIIEEKAHSYAITEEVSSSDRMVHITKGSLIPYYKDQHFYIGKEKFEMDSFPYLKHKVDRSDLKEIALSYLEAPYLWGGRTPFGIDCSGFSQIVYKIAGIKIKRDASQQVKEGKQIDLMYANTGDLAFFINANEKIHHVGILLDEHTIIHAAGKIRIDKLDEKGIYNKDRDEYTHRLYTINTYL